MGYCGYCQRYMPSEGRTVHHDDLRKCCSYLKEDFDKVSALAALYQQQVATLQEDNLHHAEQVKILLDIIDRCYPHVRMSRSITSGREFKETIDKLAEEMEKALGWTRKTDGSIQRNSDGKEQ